MLQVRAERGRPAPPRWRAQPTRGCPGALPAAAPSWPASCGSKASVRARKRCIQVGISSFSLPASGGEKSHTKNRGEIKANATPHVAAKTRSCTVTTGAVPSPVVQSLFYLPSHAPPGVRAGAAAACGVRRGGCGARSARPAAAARRGACRHGYDQRAPHAGVHRLRRDDARSCERRVRSRGRARVQRSDCVPRRVVGPVHLPVAPDALGVGRNGPSLGRSSGRGRVGSRTLRGAICRTRRGRAPSDVWLDGRRHLRVAAAGDAGRARARAAALRPLSGRGLLPVPPGRRQLCCEPERPGAGAARAAARRG